MTRFRLPAGISARLLLVFGSLIVVCIGVLGVLLVSESQRAVSTSILRDYEEIAIQAAARVQAFLDVPVQHLSTAAGAVSVLRGDVWRQENILTKLKMEFPILGTIVFTDTQGRGLVTTDTGSSPTDWAEKEAFQVAVRGEPFVSSVLFSEAEGPYTRMAVPVKLRGKVVGTLCAKVNVQGLWDLVDSIRIGRTGRARVVTRAGAIVAAADKRDAVQGSLLEGLTTRSSESFSEEHVDRDGKTWLRAYAPIHNVQWGTLVEQPSEEAYAFGNKMKKVSLAAVLMGAAAALAIAAASGQSVTRPIRKLLEGTKRVARGDLDHTVQHDGKDEIGELAKSFNTMTASLKEARRELLTEKAFVGHILEHSPAGIMTVDAQGRIATANTTLRGIAPDEGDLRGRLVADIPLFSTLGLERFLKADEARGVVTKGTEADKRVYSVRKSSLDQNGALSSILLIDDITEQKHAEEALHTALEETERAHRLLLALSRAAQALQRARTAGEVYKRLVEKVAEAGYRAAVLTLTDDRTHLNISHLGFRSDKLQAAEQLTSLSARDYRVPLPAGAFCRTILDEGKAAFVEHAADCLKEALPEQVQKLAPRVADLLGIERMIAAPLKIGKKSYGLLFVVGANLAEADIPAVTTFANQAAIAAENARLLDEAAAHRKSLQRLSAQLIKAQEAERRRISRELHDQMGQALTAIGFNLNVVEKAADAYLDPRGRQFLVEASSLIEQTLAQVRGLALDLRPDILDDLGVVAALRWYSNRWAERLKIRVGFEARSCEERLPEEVETALYRAGQEALTNVARHADASRVDLRLQRRSSTIELFIADNGKGFDVKAQESEERAERGLGLTGIRERLAPLKGDLIVGSTPGRGTELRIRIPVGRRRA